MLNRVFGNNEYFISKDGKFYNTNGKECTLGRVKNNSVRLMIHGVRRLMDVEWLRCSAMFNLKLPKHLQEDFRSINYIPVTNENIKSRHGVIMTFDKPLYFNNDFRIVPNYPELCISKTGEIWHWTKGIQLPVWTPKSKDYYPNTTFFDSNTHQKRTVMVHRLVALAWCDGFSNDAWMVNHIDGNKHNFHADNLEWVTPSQNNTHAVQNDLRSDSLKCMVLDTKTWTVHHFKSVTDACRFMEISQRELNNFNYLRPSKIIKNRFEIRIGDDTAPWIYEKGKEVRAGRYTITVKYPDGSIKTFHDRRDYQQELKVWNVPNIDAAIAKGQQLYPELKISYTDNYVNVPVQYINVKTREIKEGNTIAEVAKTLGINKSNVRNTLVAGEDRAFNGFAFRYKSDKPWSEVINEAPSNSMCILARHHLTGEEIQFKSLRAAAQHFCVDRSTITLRLDTDRDLKGWILRNVNTACLASNG